jgi:hypothetical protein
MADTDPKPGAVRFEPKCVRCGQTCATVEVIPPHTLPLDWESWDAKRRSLFQQYRKAEEFYLLYEGPGGSNGWVGDPIPAERAQRIIRALTTPTAELLSRAEFFDGAGFCESCSCFYCEKHWNVSISGGGRCPKGHFKTLDPFWSPED